MGRENKDLKETAFLVCSKNSKKTKVLRMEQIKKGAVGEVVGGRQGEGHKEHEHTGP